MEAITSWLREIPVSVIANSPLLDVIFNALDSEQSFEAAADCLCAVFRETREVDECLDTVQILLPRVIALRPRIQKVAGDSDTADVDSFRALTKVFADAGTSWVVAIARKPQHFRPLVECVLECAARDKDREVIENTFNFWYELKQYISLDSYMEARLEFVDVYSRLVDIFLKHLEYPTSESGNEADLFDGDRELEEKFRAFRHQMGDTLKDACEVMGVAECLNKVLHAIQVWLQKYASQATATVVPHWQELEAPLFAMRAMGRMVDPEENVVLPQLMPLLVQIPSHEKLRFATIMVLGRYTEWTAKHPEFLSPQFSYVVSSFSIDSKEVIRAAAMAVKYFCLDCKHLLSDQVLQLQHFYDQILDKLPDTSQEEMTEGAAVVVGAQPTEEIYKLLKLYCDPLVTRLMAKANAATTEEGRLLLAGEHCSSILVLGLSVR